MAAENVLKWNALSSCSYNYKRTYLNHAPNIIVLDNTYNRKLSTFAARNESRDGEIALSKDEFARGLLRHYSRPPIVPLRHMWAGGKLLICLFVRVKC